MHEVKKQYNYFESLEHTVKTAFALYLVIYAGGMIVTLLGVENLFSFLKTHSLMFSLVACAFVLAMFFAFASVIGKINWLGELHIRLDNRFFGFLDRSNDVIFRTLISSLEPDEQTRFFKLPAAKKNTITKSIFSNLSDENHLFDRLMSSGIFRNWIWYWVSIYGTFTFTLLTLSSFLIVWIEKERFSTPFFAITWAFALSHILVTVLIGKFLVKKTQRTVQFIVGSHRMDIANILITRIQEEPEENEDELHPQAEGE
jgi:hypothetical protein